MPQHNNMNIQTIKVGAKKWPIKYGFQALMEIEELLPGDEALTLEDMGKIAKLPMKVYPDFVLAGIRLGCSLMGKKEVPDRPEIVAAMNEDFKGVYFDAIAIFAADMGADSADTDIVKETIYKDGSTSSVVASKAGQSGN